MEFCVEIDKPWELMNQEEKKLQLFINQKNTLDAFLSRNAISKAQYEKGLGDLFEKMEVTALLESCGVSADQ